MLRPDPQLQAQLARTFTSLYGHAPTVLARAPGRVNLIGDHTDYCDGFAMPIAIDLYTLVLAAPAAQPRKFTRVASTREEVTLARPVELPLDRILQAAGDWSDYLRGVAAGYAALSDTQPPLDVLIGGDLPLGAGLSSSASLELAFALALEHSGAPSLSDRERLHLCRQAEHDYAGMPCGILDQYSVSMAQAGSAMLLDCRDATSRPVPVAKHLALAIIDSGVRHALVDGGYEQRLREARAAEAQLGRSLRGATLADLPRLDDATLRRRARHIISENARVHAFANALEEGDGQRAGDLMFDSHRSLAEDYAVSCPEVDRLVEAARAAGALGARMTGGGFGGAVICLVDTSATTDFERAIHNHLPAPDGEAALRWVRASDGAQAEAWTPA